jgi:uncharacterized protein YkwD
MKPLLFIIPLTLLALSGRAAAQPAPLAVAPTAPCRDADLAFAQKAEALIAARINEARAQLAPHAPLLASDPDLAGIARERSCAMIQGTDISHIEEGDVVADQMVHARFGPHGTSAENTMEADGKRPYGTAEFAKMTVERWMASPIHRANILNPEFDATGIGVIRVGMDAVATEVFYAHPAKSDGLSCQGGDQAFAREAEALIIAGINSQRAKFAPDAPPLSSDPDLARIAETRSCDMAFGREAFSHEDAEGRFIASDMVQASFGHLGAIGENIMKMGSVFAVGTRPFTAEEFARNAVEGWMKSPEHRENILNARFDASGVGVAMVGDEAFATQVFWGPPRVVSPPSLRPKEGKLF